MTATQAFDKTATLLEKIYDKRESQNIADLVLEHLTGKKKWQRKMDNLELSQEQFKKLELFSKELSANRPVQYVLGEAWFCGMKFFVNESVLIPRPETEELVQAIVAEQKSNRPISIIDIGSGSGCIPISIKKKIQHANILSIDVSEDALRVARQNAKANETEVSFQCIDFLDQNKWISLDRYNIIVSNPPYVPINEKNRLAKNVVEYEPGTALFVPDDDVLLFYKAIESFGGKHLLDGGKIYLEVNENHSHEVGDYFSKHGWKAAIIKDLYQKERIVTATLS